MAWMMILSTIFLGTGGIGVVPSMAEWHVYSPSEPPLALIETHKEELSPNGRKAIPGSLGYLARRDSAGPPRESHSGRSSSNPARSPSESNRQSGVPSTLSESEADLPVYEKKLDIPNEIAITPPKEDRDPIEGPGKSHSVIKKRGGVRK